MKDPHLLPEKFVERLKVQYPREFDTILPTFQKRPPVIRTNTLLISSEELLRHFRKEKIKAQPIAEFPDSFRIINATRQELTALTIYEQGFFYIQSLASQWVVKALDPKPGEKIFDMCAAPGSKTGQIALAMSGQGELLANEPHKSRFFKLVSNLQHQRLETFVKVKQYPGQNYPAFYPDHFDRVLVDAPCSSESRFAVEDAKSYQYWSKPKTKSMAKLQKRLLAAAIECARPGGIVVYSTCSFSPEENERVLHETLKKNPDLDILPLQLKTAAMPVLLSWEGKQFDPRLKNALRLKPDLLQESFFMAVLKKGQNSSKNTQVNKLAKFSRKKYNSNNA